MSQGLIPFSLWPHMHRPQNLGRHQGTNALGNNLQEASPLNAGGRLVNEAILGRLYSGGFVTECRKSGPGAQTAIQWQRTSCAGYRARIILARSSRLMSKVITQRTNP